MTQKPEAHINAALAVLERTTGELEQSQLLVKSQNLANATEACQNTTIPAIVADVKGSITTVEMLNKNLKK